MTLASVLLAALGFMLLIILHEAGHFAAAKWVGMRVERFALFFPPLIWKKQVGETEYAIGSIPAGGYVRISGMNPSEDLPDEVRDRAYHAQPPWKRMVVIAAGPLMNILIAFVLLFSYLVLIGPRNPEKASGTVDVIEKGYPAAKALEPGDRVVSVDGVSGGPGELSDAISSHECRGEPVEGCRAATPATVVIQRDDERRTLELRPIYDPGTERTRLGFSYLDDGPRETFAVGEGTTQAADRLWFITKATVSLPARIFDAQKRKEISGVVGSYEVTRQTILNDVAQVVWILA
ncbi:MAG: M50 family metallopeptidase, partial [Thermoleophilaceae bacterium]